jgi:hypothetical protein
VSVSKKIAFLLGWDNAVHHFDKCNPRVGCGCQVWCDICAEMHRLDFLHIWQRKRDYPLWIKNALADKLITTNDAQTFYNFIRNAPEYLDQVRPWEKTYERPREG